MILHSCPHCHVQSLFDPLRGGDVACAACGRVFRLSAFTRVNSPLPVRLLRFLAALPRRIRIAPPAVYSLTGAAILLICWLLLSALAFLPPDWRVVNRRFATSLDESSMDGALALCVMGRIEQKGVEFDQVATAFAITADGYYLTARSAVPVDKSIKGVLRSSSRVWLYVRGERLDTRVVYADPVADFAIVKTEVAPPYRWSIGGRGDIPRLNVAVIALGFPAAPVPLDPSLIATKYASVPGSIARMFQDAVGTWWIEHTGIIPAGALGGPLVIADKVVGISVVAAAPGRFSRAIDLQPFAPTIWRTINEDRARKEHQ